MKFEVQGEFWGRRFAVFVSSSGLQKKKVKMVACGIARNFRFLGKLIKGKRKIKRKRKFFLMKPTRRIRPTKAIKKRRRIKMKKKKRLQASKDYLHLL